MPFFKFTCYYCCCQAAPAVTCTFYDSATTNRAFSCCQQGGSRSAQFMLLHIHFVSLITLAGKIIVAEKVREEVIMGVTLCDAENYYQYSSRRF